MKRFHLNPATGEPGPCRAKVSCPFGDLETEHYTSKEEARAQYEARMARDIAIQRWEASYYLDKDPLRLNSQKPVSEDFTATPNGLEDSEDWAETKIYEAEPVIKARVNELLGLPSSTKVFIEDHNSEYWLSDVTSDHVQEVKIRAGEVTKTFPNMHKAVQWLAHGDKPNPKDTILKGFSGGEWTGGKVTVLGAYSGEETVTPTRLYPPEAPEGFYAKGDSPLERWYDFSSVWLKEQV